jgi:DASS family divalent anion:Na+ symporter
VRSFASPTWFLLIAILGLAASLASSGLLERLAIRLMLLFPATFRGQTTALLLGGLVMTPVLPLTVARCAMTAPLATVVARTLRYAPGSRPAVGIGLAAFVGAGLLSRGFLSGATLNLIAWGLLPDAARPTWLAWALAAIPVTMVTALGSLAIILSLFRPSSDAPLPDQVLSAELRARGRLSRNEWLAGAAALAVFGGFALAPPTLNSTWLAGAGFLFRLALGVLKRDQVRSALDWPLLLFLGETLSLPAMVRDLGLDATVVSAATGLLPPAHCSPLWSIAVLFLLTLAARVVLSEWVMVPLLTVASLPAAPALDLHPWIIAFVVLVGANVWMLPHQFPSYLAFVGGSGGALWTATSTPCPPAISARRSMSGPPGPAPGEEPARWSSAQEMEPPEHPGRFPKAYRPYHSLNASRGRTRRSRNAPPRQPRRAVSMVATSIFFIDIIAPKTRLASAPPAASASVSTRGVICQDRPQRSLHHPHSLSWPPLPTIAFQ